MELYPENLQNYVLDNYPLDPGRAVCLMKDLARTLERLSHPADSAFMVTDLKPSNLLLSAEGRVFIGDLGGLKRISSVSTLAGSQFSPSWCAPEIMLRGERPQVSAAVYSYGLVSYYIWEGRLPYEDEDFSQRPRLIQENGVTFTRRKVPGKVQSLIRHCLAFDTEKRLKNFSETLQCLQEDLRQDIPEISIDSGIDPPGGSAVPASVENFETSRWAASTGTVKKPQAGGTWVEPLTGMVFVNVPGASFNMGCLGRDPLAADNEKPCHTVRIDDFWLGKFPVTQNQWQSVMGGNPSHFQKGDNFPVEQVSWTDAVTFAKKLSSLHDGKFNFWLPSEAQWEFAARSGGMPEQYAGGEDAETLAWYKDNSGYSPHPVGKKAPNGLGFYDMSGNVLEWCSDVYLADAYRLYRHAKTESSDSTLYRVVRGGSWTHDARHCRSTARRGFSAGLRYTSLGFRVVRVD